MSYLTTLVDPHSPELFWALDEASAQFHWLGEPDTGPAWEYPGGVEWTITSGQAHTAADVSLGNAVVDSGVSDGDVQVTVATQQTGGDNQGLVFRLTNGGNWWRAVNDGSNLYLEKYVNAGLSTVSFTGVTVANGDTIKVNLSGSTIKVYYNGTLKITATDSFNSTATKHGIHAQQCSEARFDSFSVVDTGATTVVSDGFGRSQAGFTAVEDTSGNNLDGQWHIYGGQSPTFGEDGPFACKETSVAPLFDPAYNHLAYRATSPFSGTGDFTMELWFRPPAGWADGITFGRILFQQRPAGSNDGMIRMFLDVTTDPDRFGVVIGGAGGVTVASTTAAATIADNLECWNYAAVTRDSADLVTLYLNGELITTGSSSRSLTADNLSVGFDYPDRGHNLEDEREEMSGRVAAFAIYSTCADASLIADRWNYGCPCSDVVPPLRLTPRDDDSPRLYPPGTSRQRSIRIGRNTYW